MAEKIHVQVGDRVKASKFVYDTSYAIEGTVVRLETDRVHGQSAKIKSADGETDWYLCENSYDNKMTNLSRNVPTPETSLPKNAVGWCHYCGQPAYGFGFFDEPACGQCGGK